MVSLVLMTAIGFEQASIAQYIRPGHWNDPDMLEVGNGGMTDDEYRVHMSLWCLLAAPLLAGNDLRDMSHSTLAMLTNRDVIAVDQNPAAQPVKRTAQGGNTEVWTRPLQDGSIAVGLFNRDAQAQPVSVTWSTLGVAGQVRARDLWKHEDVSIAGDTYTATVPGHAVVLLRVQGLSGPPSSTR